jgi:hypothetical protein
MEKKTESHTIVRDQFITLTKQGKAQLRKISGQYTGRKQPKK